MGLRRELRKLISRSARRGDKQSAPRLGFDHEAAAELAIPRVRDRTMIAHPALLSLWAQVRHCEVAGLPGAFVECGVWKGGAAGLMALANQAYSTTRRPLHLFDIFDNICEPDPELDGERALNEVKQFAGRDRTTLTGKMESLTGVYDHLGGPGDAELVERFIADELGYGREATLVHKGWFQDTIPVVETGPIAILRLDGDWYASTKICLDHLYERVVPGGFVIVDDYGTYEGCQKAVDELLAGLPQRPFLNVVTADVRYWIKPEAASMAA
ncbi:TylF/MycF/NovP-related O-methyltransferase [Tabrizicola aquatica]|uniref:TylF/MycF/NovP-related O-methyltransferase n=1 Tax=Tabrizicola aquatica TaxID=909926 RepID=UPI000CCFDFBE|nr:TylF/MycF/NovP-related O-methyltransferase [Tabrizicola aquatica]